MVELKSMPIAASLYPEPPYHYPNAEMVAIIYNGDRDQLAEIVPAPLKMSKSPMIFAFVAWYPETTIGPYFEAATLIQVRLKTDDGKKYESLYCNSMFVDSDHAIAAGREIWGFPKKFAEMSVKKEGNKRVGVLRRKDIDVMKITVEPKEPLTQFPNVNTLTMKQILMPDGSGYELQELVETPFQVELVNSKSGAATIEFQKSDEDPLYVMQPKAVLQGVYGINNLILPYGRIVWKSSP